MQDKKKEIMVSWYGQDVFSIHWGRKKRLRFHVFSTKYN